MSARGMCVTAAVLFVVASLGSGCTSDDAGFAASGLTYDEPLPSPVPTIATEVRESRGQIISQSQLDPLSERIGAHAAAAKQADYQSTSGVTGARTEVSGAFFIPLGEPPQGGWPVVALAHGTSGTQHGCAPSQTADLRGEAGLVVALLSKGYAVAATDYQGLREQGLHPYLEPRTSAFNVIDSVRALRALFGSVSDRWVAFGPSQGGQAAWAVNELNGTYGDGLQLQGTVALSPAVNISDLADRAFSGALTGWQSALMPLVVDGLARYDRTIVVSHYLRGETAKELNTITGCGPEALHTRARLAKSDDVKPTTVADATALRDALRRIALPQGPLTVPMLVMNGSKDESIMPSWVSGAVERACNLGGRVQHMEIQGVGQSNLGHDAVTLHWISERFAGLPVPQGCGDLP